MMTSRTFAQYPDYKILEHCRCITLDDLSSSSTISNNEIKIFASAIKTATAHGCAAHLVAWRDGVVACVVSGRAKSFRQVSPSTLIAAYRNAVAGGDVVYRDFTGGMYA